MNALVLDASVVAAAFFNEEYAGPARNLLTGEASLRSPDLIHAELANVIWKRYRRGEIDKDEAAGLLADFRTLPLRISPCVDLAQAALELAIMTGRSVYDCLYLALAIRDDAVLISADKRFVSSLAGTPLARHVAWLGSAPYR